MAIATAVGLALGWIVIDFREWKEFGTGGTAPTWAGYWRMTKLRILRMQSDDDLRDASKLKDEGPQYLKKDLATRKGERPVIIGRTMPQRQKPGRLDPALKERLHGIPKQLCEKHSDILKLDLSATEGRSTDGIYAKPDLPGRDAAAKDKIIKDEIAHVHPADDSLHVWLSPKDAKVAVEKGWGERFPLSALGMCHPSFIMVYAPRSAEEVDTVEDIVKAGIGYLTGKKL